MTKKRLMAGAAALVVVAVGVTGLQGLANAYGPSSVTLPGTLFLGNSSSNNTPTTLNTFTDTITLTQTPTNPNAGNSVLVALSGANGPSTGPVGVSANGTVIRAKISLTGAQTATVELASYNDSSTGAAGTPACTYPATSIGTSSPEGAWASYGQFTASGNGSAAIALNNIFFDDQGDGYTFGSNVCSGTANNADYYVSGGGTSPLNAKTSSVDSTVVKNTFTITGPNASVFAIGGAINGATNLTTRVGGTTSLAAAKTATNVGTVNLRGTVWDVNKVSSDFTVEFCNTSGSSCDTALTAPGKVLSTDGSGQLVGRVRVPATATTGLRAIKLTQGTNTSLTPITIIGTGTLSISPSNGGPGTVVATTGGDFSPSEAIVTSAYIPNTFGTVTYYYANSDGSQNSICSGYSAGVTKPNTCFASGPFVRGNTNQYVSPLPTVGGAGTYSASVTVADSNTVGIQNAAKSKLCSVVTTEYDYSSAASAFTCANYNTTADIKGLEGQGGAKAVAFTVNQDRCVAYTGDTTGGAGCVTKQNVNVSVLQGNLTQRAYVNTTAATGTGVASSAATTPVVGTSNVNSDATTINLGTLTTPFAPTVVTGTLNDITVSDNRGGTNGWSLTATAVDFTGTPSGSISKSALAATTTCAAADATNAWDYSNASKVAISGFDASLNAPGATAGASASAFSGTVNLCTKSTTTNATTGSTGGIYNVGGSLALTVPAFQKAARYVSTITVTLA